MPEVIEGYRSTPGSDAPRRGKFDALDRISSGPDIGSGCRGS